MTIRFALQIPNFSYGTGVSELYPTVIAQAQEAEAAGFDSVFVMDHFYQLPMIGTPDQPMLEAYTALGGLAVATEKVQLGTLVTGNTYRNPTLLAKAITTLDVISQGRAVLGIGTGWFELEHDSLGYEFGTFTDRFNKLDEALEIILPMLAGERPTVEGKYYRTREAMAEPRFRDHIPLMIGGSGEKKTIPLAAKHFDHLNVIAGFDELPRKVQVVKEACEKIGRDPATLETSHLAIAIIDENVTADVIPDDFKQQAVYGSPEQVADQIKTKVLDAGIDGVIISPVTSLNGYQPGGITAVAELLRPLLAVGSHVSLHISAAPTCDYSICLTPTAPGFVSRTAAFPRAHAADRPRWPGVLRFRDLHRHRAREAEVDCGTSSMTVEPHAPCQIRTRYPAPMRAVSRDVISGVSSLCHSLDRWTASIRFARSAVHSVR